MHTLDLYEKSLEVAQQLGFQIRQEWLNGQEGGYCEIAGKKFIFVDISLNSMEKLEQVLEALQNDSAWMSQKFRLS